MEVVGKQWMWNFRLPGDDGKLGNAKVSLISLANPLGIDPDDPAGQDDIIINSNELHMPIDKPVKMVLRSLDVLHNFYVPQFRAKMDMVPGQVSYFWFTPTKLGNYEILCAEYCGVAHYNMRGKVFVQSAQDYQKWLQQQPTFAASLRGSNGVGLVEQGRQLAENSGCYACHSIDGSPSLGPGWKGLFGKTETLADGTTVLVDEAYFKESITNPNAKLVQGYSPVMVAYNFSEAQLDALVAFTRSLDAASSDDATNNTSASGAPESADNTSSSEAGLQSQGEQISQSLGCIACHSIDGSKSLGPTWAGLLGREELLVDGTSVIVDDDYLRESIVDPSAKLVQGYTPVMQPYALTDEQLLALIEYMKSF